MAKYSDFLYGGALYGDIALVDFSAEPLSSRIPLEYSAQGITDNIVRVTWKTPSKPATNFVAARLVRNQDAFAETQEDGIVVWSWQYTGVVPPTSDSVIPPFDTDFDDGFEYTKIPIEGGRYVYYRMWLQKAADNTWVPGGDTWVLVPKHHSTTTTSTGELVSTHDKFMDIIPRVYTSLSASPLDEVNPNSALYNFLYGFSYTLDEMLTFADLILPEVTGRYQNPNLLLPQADSLGLDTSNIMVTKSQKKMIREALYIYSRKGTALSLGTLVESVTGYSPTLTYSPNLMLTNQDSTFNKSVGSWRAIGNATITSDDATGTPNSVPSPPENSAIDNTYVGKIVVGTNNAQISNGENSPATLGVSIGTNTSYDVTWYLKSATAGTVTLSVSWYDYKGTFISTSTATGAVASSSWTKVTSTVTSPNVTSGQPLTPRFATLKYTFSLAGTYYLDMIQFAAAGTSGFNEAREIGITLEPSKLNYVKNPSFENSTHGTSWTFTNFGTPTYPTTSLPDTPDGAVMAQAATSATNATLATTTDALSVTGEHYVFSAWMKTTTSTATAKLTLADNHGHTVTSSDFTLNTSWSRPQVTLMVPYTSSSTTLTATIKIAESGKTINVDAAQIEPAFVATDYFDGATANSVTTSWKGTAHNSVSCYYDNRLTKFPMLVLALYNNLPQNTPYTLKTYGFGDVKDITY